MSKEITSNLLFTVMIDKERTKLHAKFRQFMELYKQGQEFGCLPEKPTKEVYKKFDELMKILGYFE